jgi:hypothetical protein
MVPVAGGQNWNRNGCFWQVDGCALIKVNTGSRAWAGEAPAMVWEQSRPEKRMINESEKL